jgi:hypothetical protein
MGQTKNATVFGTHDNDPLDIDKNGTPISGSTVLIRHVPNVGNVLHFFLLKMGNSPSKQNWLVVLTHLKNISQWEGLSHILWKIKNV